jgi:hypothetical protein
MARTTSRSAQAITTPARNEAAYQRASARLQHAPALGIAVLRIQYMSATQFIEVDLSDPLSAAQRDHLGLQGPV